MKGKKAISSSQNLLFDYWTGRRIKRLLLLCQIISKSEDILEEGAQENISPKGGITSGWRKLHDERLRSLYALPNAVLFSQ
jgi:hypothetical protein